MAWGVLLRHIIRAVGTSPRHLVALRFRILQGEAVAGTLARSEDHAFFR